MTDTIGPVADLRDWLARVDRIGELQRIDAAVDAREEMSAITYLLAKTETSPAVLFDTSSNTHGFRHLWNLFGPSVARTAIA